MGTFLLPLLDATFSLINMISLVTSVSLGSSNPLVVSIALDLRSYGFEIPLPVMQLDPLSFSSSECLDTSNHLSKRKKKNIAG